MVAGAEVTRLYRSTLRAAGLFTDNNFRHYFARRAKEDFRAFAGRLKQGKADSEAKEAFMAQGQENLAMLKRQGMVSQLYKSSPPPGRR
mmetsp:Transcript_21492/g.64148  ORF Transcript_21492/g.64148 Transcript_21492/m.64148 type:complete len:89 (-) Transcript_21492:87-353(-)